MFVLYTRQLNFLHSNSFIPGTIHSMCTKQLWNSTKIVFCKPCLQCIIHIIYYFIYQRENILQVCEEFVYCIMHIINKIYSLQIFILK